MKTGSKKNRKKLKLVLELLAEESTSLTKVEKIGKLLKGVNPKIDKELTSCVRILGKINKVAGGDVVGLSLEKLPEKSKKERKRKKLILLLLTHFRSLKGEVKRINDLTAAGAAAGSTVSGGKEAAGGTAKVVKTAKILATLKGPAGIVTIAAAGIVAVGVALNSSAVTVTIVNQGCRPLGPVSSRAINLPGLQLPAQAIGSGSQAVAKIPGLKMKVRMDPGEVSLSAFNFTQSYDLPGEMVDVIYDGVSMMGRTSEVNLGNAKKHEVIFRCAAEI